MERVAIENLRLYGSVAAARRPEHEFFRGGDRRLVETVARGLVHGCLGDGAVLVDLEHEHDVTFEALRARLLRILGLYERHELGLGHRGRRGG